MKRNRRNRKKRIHSDYKILFSRLAKVKKCYWDSTILYGLFIIGCIHAMDYKI